MFTITARLIDPGALEPDSLLARAGLQKGGPVQCLIDQRVIDYCQPYVPASPDRTLEFSAPPSTEIGSGTVIWNTPYAHYQYMGIVYGPNFQVLIKGKLEWRSRKGRPKHPTDKKLTYDKAQNPLAGPHWVERMKADRMRDIVREAQNLVKRELK